MKAQIHWNIQKRKWTIHTYKGCEWATHLYIEGAWYTEVSPNRPSNPRGWVVADRKQVKILDGDSNFPKGERLKYDKINMRFNITQGNGIIFLPEGAFLIKD